MRAALAIVSLLLLVSGVLYFALGDDCLDPDGVEPDPATVSELEESIDLGPPLEGRDREQANEPETFAPEPESEKADEAPASTPPEPESKGPRIARSFLDGRPLPEFEVGLDAFKQEGDDAREVLLFREEREGWFLVGGHLAGATKELWAIPTATLMLEVETFDGPLDPKAVTIKLQHPDTNYATKFHFEGEPKRLRTQAVPWVLDVRAVPESLPGIFELRVPRLEGVLVHVRASGFRNAWFELPVADRSDIALSQRVTLVRTPSVTGQFVDFQGDGVKPDQVMAYLRISAPVDRWELEKLAYGGAASGWSVVGSHPAQAIVFKQGVNVQDDGTFRYVVQQRGDVVLHGRKKGQASVLRELLDVDRDDRDLGAVLLEPTREIRTKLVGKPIETLFANSRVTFVARNEVGLLPDIHAQSDAEGVVSLTNLVAGQEYKIRCYPAEEKLRRIVEAGEWWFAFEDDDGKQRSYFVWDGQEEIKITAIRVGD